MFVCGYSLERGTEQESSYVGGCCTFEDNILKCSLFLTMFAYVYDVTSYLDDHPGGDEVVLLATGKDATDEFEDAGHSQSARELMEKFCIGEVDPSPPVSSKNQAAIYSEKFLQLTKQYWAVPVAVLGISVIAGFLYLRKK
ncbi:cytochrome b5 isoform X1 [Prosopis cineraria]|uniref:cytochrome b5 isoform X1 n=1 Tax=Prosopis cineraria TaxID=364024 RepID=UPI0024106000|nr:cytochrome b5 isoform X1 [Prosopis cineraria]